MKIYISGPITGYDLKERERYFRTAANYILAILEETPVNPMQGVDTDRPMTHAEYMRRDIAMLLDCDAILMLPGWSHSQGCNLEYAIATTLGIKILTPQLTEETQEELKD